MIAPSVVRVPTRRSASKRRLQTVRTIGLPTAILLRAVIVVAVLGLWQLAVDHRIVDPFFVPAPTKVGSWLLDASRTGVLWKNLASTVKGMLLAFSIGSAGGIILGLLFGRFPNLEAVVSPFVTFLNALPRVALAPLFILYLGIGIWSKVAVGIGTVFFILLLNTRAGIRGVDPDLVSLATVLRFPPRQIFLKVLLPNATASIFAGLRLGAVYALLGVVVGELLASESGLGQLIALNSNTGNIAGVFGSLFVLALLAMLLSGVMSLLERRLLRWQNK